MALPQFFEFVRNHPPMYLHKVTYDVAAGFIDGFDEASNSTALLGFREWLIVRVGYGNNLTWPPLALQLIFPNAKCPRDELKGPPEERQAVESLFAILEEFWEDRSGDGLRRIYRKYENWLKRQDWYDPSSPSWIPEGDNG